MRLPVALAVALSAAAPPAAKALDVAGGLGFGYTRVDNWAPGPVHTSAPTLALDANLNVAGFFSSPDVFVWSAGAGYNRVRQSFLDQTTTTSGYAYHLHLGAFETRNSLVSLSGDVSRSNTDYSLNLAANALTGTTTENSYQATVAVRPPGRPAFWASGGYREGTNTGFGRTETTDATKRLSAGFSHGPGPYTVNGSYEGLWNTGTLDGNNWDRTTVQLNGSVSVSASDQGYFSTLYQRRTPTAVGAYNPTAEYDAVAAGYNWRDPGFIGSSGYSYSHLAFAAPGSPSREAISNGLHLAGERAYAPEWTGVGTAEVSVNQSRLGTEQQTSGGQTLGVTARWFRGAAPGASEWLAEAGPLFGALEPAGASAEFGYGLHGRGRWGLQSGVTRYGAEYQLEFADKLHGLDGWTLSQRLNGEAGTRLNEETYVKVTLTASALRQSIAMFGSGTSREAHLAGYLGWRRVAAGLEVGTQDAATGSLSGFPSDGLFIPAAFQTHSRYVLTTASYAVMRHLDVNARVRYASSTGPEVATQRELLLGGGLGYTYGLFRLSLDDRYVAGGSADLVNRSNVFMLTITRALAARY